MQKTKWMTKNRNTNAGFIAEKLQKLTNIPLTNKDHKRKIIFTPGIDGYRVYCTGYRYTSPGLTEYRVRYKWYSVRHGLIRYDLVSGEWEISVVLRL